MSRDKKDFYREQAEKFREFSNKFPTREPLSLFEEWAESKDFCDEDKQEIWQIVRHLTS